MTVLLIVIIFFHFFFVFCYYIRTLVAFVFLFNDIFRRRQVCCWNAIFNYNFTHFSVLRALSFRRALRVTLLSCVLGENESRCSVLGKFASKRVRFAAHVEWVDLKVMLRLPWNATNFVCDFVTTKEFSGPRLNSASQMYCIYVVYKAINEFMLWVLQIYLIYSLVR